jgi:Xaa-Pro aminopeptidase
MTRGERLADLLDHPLLVTCPTNVRYLTGLSSSNAAALVEPGATTLYTDFRYAEAARAIAEITSVETRRDLIGELAERLATRQVAFEAAHLSYADSVRLAAAGIELVPTTGIVEALRAVKERVEIDAIRRAAEISDDVFEALAGVRFTGRTERELAWWIEGRFHDLGAESLAFPVVVAAAENGARPHARPRAVPIPVGTLVTVDAGCRVDGYCSDCTRTFATGDVGDELRRAYELCSLAQDDALAALRPGIAARDVDAASRTRLEHAGLGERYGHGLGHGVGLDVHEAPTLRPDTPSTELLEPGNVVTVEPGLYLPGVGGVRIEDLVLVTADGPERLTRATKELTAVA